MVSPRSPKPSRNVTEARAVAQRGKLDGQAEERRQQAATKTPASKPPRGRKGAEDPISKRRAAATLERAIADFLDDQEGGNHSAKTLEWHRTALGLFSRFLAEERSITLVVEIDAPDISAWFASMRKTPCIGYLDHPFKNRPFETGQDRHPCLQTQAGWCTIRRRHKHTHA